jgi:hypothetical protein
MADEVEFVGAKAGKYEELGEKIDLTSKGFQSRRPDMAPVFRVTAASLTET